MGSDQRRDKNAFEAELPQHEVKLPSYYIAHWPVTVAQFAAFVGESGFKLQNSDSLKGIVNHPVIGVSWYDAMAYCRWLNERLRGFTHERSITQNTLSETQRRFWRGLTAGSLAIGLPSEAEWEKAARGTDRRIYPWGDDPDPNRANYDKTGLGTTSTVGCFPNGARPHGVEELSGNVFEWTRSLFGDYPYPSEGAERQKREDPAARGRRVLRGGAFGLDARSARCAFRLVSAPDFRVSDSGFRVVASPFFSDR